MKFQSVGEKEDALKHETRHTLYQTLQQSPGLGVGNLVKILNMNRGTISHHLAVLKRLGLVDSHRVSKYTLYTIPKPAERSTAVGTPPSAEAIAALRRRGGGEIASIVMERPGVVQKELTAATGMNRKVLRPLLDLMIRTGLLLEHKESRFCLYFPTPDLERVMEYIGLFEPTDQDSRPSTSLRLSAICSTPSTIVEPGYVASDIPLVEQGISFFPDINDDKGEADIVLSEAD